MSTAVHDSTHKPSVVSVSWGESEDAWSAQARTADGADPHRGRRARRLGHGGRRRQRLRRCRQRRTAARRLPRVGAARAGLRGHVACRRRGRRSSPRRSGTTPATAPPAEASAASLRCPVTSPPPMCRSTSTRRPPGAGSPTCAGNADPQTGYRVLVDGTEQVIGGTSAVAPLWAGLIARLDQHLGSPLGFAQPALYPLLGSDSFHDITSGNNGAYAAGPGWDACTGLGSPERHGAGGSADRPRRRRLRRPVGDAAGERWSHMMRRSWRM